MTIALKIAGVALALILTTSAAAYAQDGQPATQGGPIVGQDTPLPPSDTRGGPIVGGDEPLEEPGSTRPEVDQPEPPNGGNGGGNGGGSGSPAETPTEPNPDIGSVDATPQFTCGAIGWQGGGPRDGVMRNIWFKNVGAGPIYPITSFSVTTSTGETFQFEVDVTVPVGEYLAFSNVFPNGVPADFSCEVMFT